jgi:hypothetical protein
MYGPDDSEKTVSKKRKWSAKDLANRVKTRTQGRNRIKALHRMIATQNYKMNQSEIMKKKFYLEINLLKNKWEIDNKGDTLDKIPKKKLKIANKKEKEIKEKKKKKKEGDPTGDVVAKKLTKQKKKKIKK